MYNTVLVRTPLRISFMGGGSDNKYFYTKNEGKVLSLAINKYVYVIIKKHSHFFKEKFRLSYSEHEVVNSINKIKHNIIKECLNYTDTKKNIQISTFSDLPSLSGLGSSSAVTIGILKGLFFLKNQNYSNIELASMACDIEINKLKKPIGKQDQYATAIGGLNQFTFHKDESVSIQNLNIKRSQLDYLMSNCCLYWTGLQRKADYVLNKQKSEYDEKTEKYIKQNVILTDHLIKELNKKKINLLNISKLISESWINKKKYSSIVSNDKIEKIYNQLIN